MDVTTSYVLLGICLFLSGFFSSAETAFIGLSRVRVANMVHENRRNAHKVLRLKDHAHKLLITILIGNNLVNILASALATKVAIEAFGNRGVGIAVGAMTFLILLFGEIVPKCYAANHPEALSQFEAPFLVVMQWVFFPVIWFFERINQIVFRLFGGLSSPIKITEADVLQTIELSKKDGGLQDDKSELLHNVFEFDETIVEEIQTPRERVFSLNVTTSLRDALDQIIEKGFSRIPVWDQNPDNIIGILHVKDAFKALVSGKGSDALKPLLDKPFFVPDTKSIPALLREFQKRKMHMAVVLNEFGGFAGIVTLEDLLEELVGEIYDETDPEDFIVRRLADKDFVVKGDCEIEVFNKEVGVEIPEHEDYLTVAGFVLKSFGRIPVVGDRIRLEKMIIVVASATDKKINHVKVKLR